MRTMQPTDSYMVPGLSWDLRMNFELLYLNMAFQKAPGL